MPAPSTLRGQIQDNQEKAKVQESFLKYTAQQMKFELIRSDNKELENYKVQASDREYQFWKRNPLSVDLWSRHVFLQKLHYIPYRTASTGRAPYWVVRGVPQGTSNLQINVVLRTTGFAKATISINSFQLYVVCTGSNKAIFTLPTCLP